VRFFWARDRMPGDEVHPYTTFHEQNPAVFSARKETLVKANQFLGPACGLCHYWGGEPPQGGPDSSYKFAPEIAGVEERLRPRWLYPWLRQPALVYPGTPMTSADYKEIGGGNQEEGLKAAIEVLMNFRRVKAATPAAPPPPPPQEKKEPEKKEPEKKEPEKKEPEKKK
jgi:hypothetical protein